MAEETLYCPSCNQRVRVPEEMLGQPVQCPLCRLVFTAPARGGAPAVVPLPIGSAGQPSTAPIPWQPGMASPGGRPGFVLAPGIALLVVGFLGLLLNSFRLLNLVLAGQRGMEAQIQQSQAIFQQLMPGAENPFAQLQPQSLFLMSLAIAGLFFLADVLVILGGLQMVRGRKYGLALTGSIVAMINCACCFLGFPFGLWALIVLLRPDVRNLFA